MSPDPRAAPDIGAPGGGLAGSGQPRRVCATSLFGGAREIVIVYHGQEYRLRITKANKLILTK